MPIIRLISLFSARAFSCSSYPALSFLPHLSTSPASISFFVIEVLDDFDCLARFLWIFDAIEKLDLLLGGFGTFPVAFGLAVEPRNRCERGGIVEGDFLAIVGY